MIYFAIMFLCGNLLVHSLKILPSYSWLFILLFIALCIALYLMRRIVPISLILMTLGFSAGFAYTLVYANSAMKNIIPDSLEGKTIIVEGTIDSIPVARMDGETFEFQITKLLDQQYKLQHLPRVRLHYRTEQKLIPGDHWRFAVKLKRNHGLLNDGGVDYAAYAIQHGIGANGYVLPKGIATKLTTSKNTNLLLLFRYRLFEHLKVLIPSSEIKHWLLALIVGERQNVPHEHWDILRRTGTNHLMAIAGLHFGIVIGVIRYLSNITLSAIPSILLRVPAPFLITCIGLIAGWAYAALAGFSIPTIRAVLMLTVFSIADISRYTTSNWRVLALSIILMLLISPFMTLNQAFWLSCGTIVIIFYTMSHRLYASGWWWKLGRIQYVIAIGLTPLSIEFFSEISVIAFVANAIAIPMLAIFILPWLLLATIISALHTKLAIFIFECISPIMSLLWSILQYLSSLPIATIAFPSHGFFITFCLFVATFLFLLPRAIPLISAVIIWLLPLCYLAAEKPAYGEMWVHVLDVGQGLSVIVQTKEHVLLYDAGLRYQEYNSGEAVILPYLKFHGISRIDHMMISHGDNDHKGGASYVYNNMKVMRIKSSVPHKLDFAASDYCLAGDRFTWDGVEFKVLSPDLTNLHQGNNSSCVLMIESRHHRVLLTGDIESAAEKSLLAKPYNLKVDLLIAPHHGSKTSSTEAFVARTMPRYVVYPIGYRNRYHFPHESVVRRYDAINSYGIRTTESGSLLFKLHNNETIRYSAYRAKNCHYWYSCFIMA